MDANDLIAAVKKLLAKVNFSQLTGVAIVIVIFGLILLAFTFILPVLAIGAAIVIIVGVILFIYKLIGGK